MGKYGEIKAQLKANLKSALLPLGLRDVVGFQPQSLAAPVVLATLESFRRSQAGQVTITVYRFQCRLALVDYATEDSEAQMETYLDAMLDAIDADPQFSGVLISGLAGAPDGKTGFFTLGQTGYRYVDVFVEATSKTAYAGAL